MFASNAFNDNNKYFYFSPSYFCLIAIDFIGRSHQRTRQRQRTRNKHVNDNPANSDGRLKEEEVKMSYPISFIFQLSCYFR